MKAYPDCGYLGSETAELTTFALTLRLVARLKDEGHTHACATLSVAYNTPCQCGAIETAAKKGRGAGR